MPLREPLPVAPEPRASARLGPTVHRNNGTLTITAEIHHRPGDADTLALSALGWVLADDDRAERLLSLTGLTPDVLRDNLTDRTTLAAVLEYLAGHEPDLLLAADALNVPP
ncbi:MAG: DUF3572 family protein, partial [Tsuneonella troitsensis]